MSSNYRRVNIADPRISAWGRGVATVWLDNGNVGRMAARHLLSYGTFKSAGYIHELRSDFYKLESAFYSEERLWAFRETMAATGIGTSAFSPAAARLANAALGFIAANRLRNITPEDVAAHLGCSRRLAEVRLSEVCGKTLHQAIEEARMEEVRRRLREGETVRDIVRDMRFTSAKQLYRIYSRHFGQGTRRASM